MAQSHDKLLAANVETPDPTKRKILKPDEEIIALEDLPPLNTWIYVLMYGTLIAGFVILLYLTFTEVEDPGGFLINIFALGTAFTVAITYIAGILNIFFGMKTAYTRKIFHITVFSLPFILDAVVGELEEEGPNAQIALFWNLWSSEAVFMMFTIPTRKAFNYCLGDVRDKDNSKWKRFLNYPSLALAALDRSEDRPNTLKWIQIQIVLIYVFIIIISIISESLDLIALESVVLIPTIIGGFGDGLAEPVGRKWGANYQYKTHGCCTQYDYVRSYPGSFMVWLSGIVAVGFNFEEFSTIQFIIGMLVIPVMGTVVEAKAPHTMDNPFIVLFVGVTVMAVASIPL